MRVTLDKVRDKGEFMEMALRHFCELNPDFDPSPDWRSQYFEGIQSNPDRSLRWILADGVRAGFILYGIEPHRFLQRLTGAIYELYVLPGSRQKGIARNAAQLAIAELRSAHPSKIQLEIMEGNMAALNLWKSLGFTKVSERFTLAGD